MGVVVEKTLLVTSGVVEDPQPFVFQSSLDDFYVSYELKVYANEAIPPLLIRSELHQNIQDTCIEFGIEILSPHYRAHRDGGESPGG